VCCLLRRAFKSWLHAEGAPAPDGAQPAPAGSKRAPGSLGGKRDVGANEPTAQALRQDGQLTKTEHRASGVVSGEVLSAYARAVGGVPIFAFLLSLYVATECVRVASSVWLSVWTSDGGQSSSAGGGAHDVLLGFWRDVASGAHVVGRRHTPMFYLGVYCAISIGQARPTLSISLARSAWAMAASPSSCMFVHCCCGTRLCNISKRHC
jgi:hypothetical protein